MNFCLKCISFPKTKFYEWFMQNYMRQDRAEAFHEKFVGTLSTLIKLLVSLRGGTEFNLNYVWNFWKLLQAWVKRMKLIFPLFMLKRCNVWSVEATQSFWIHTKSFSPPSNVRNTSANKKTANEPEWFASLDESLEVCFCLEWIPIESSSSWFLTKPVANSEKIFSDAACQQVLQCVHRQ